jgi:hypothetical protein
MKARIKLLIGMAFAGAAIMAVSQSPDKVRTQVMGAGKEGACYSQAEVELLMKANEWSREQAETILELACQFSQRSK